MQVNYWPRLNAFWSTVRNCKRSNWSTLCWAVMTPTICWMRCCKRAAQCWRCSMWWTWPQYTVRLCTLDYSSICRYYSIGSLFEILTTHRILLQVLVISPQSVDDDILTLLADSKVRHLHLLQNQYTPCAARISACSAKAWRTVKRDNPDLCVHLRVESTGEAEALLQPEAPVVSIVYSTPKTRVT